MTDITDEEKQLLIAMIDTVMAGINASPHNQEAKDQQLMKMNALKNKVEGLVGRNV